MRSLFLRILVWFWAAILLLILAAIVALVLAAPEEDPETDRWRGAAGAILADQGRRAADLHETGGRAAADAFIEQWEALSHARCALLDAEGVLVAGATAPPEAARLARGLDQAGAVGVVRIGPVTWVATALASSAGTPYVIARELPGPRDPRAAAGGSARPRGPERPARGLGGGRRRGRDGAFPPPAGPEPIFDLPPDRLEAAIEILPTTAGAAAPRPIALATPRAFAVILAALLPLSGIVCFWLARSIVVPVVTLRDAARRFAEGDLAARAGPAVARRHDALGALGRDFDEMAARIESLVGAQTRLLHDVSHELRSPLARLAIALALARRAEDDPGPALDRIEREATRLDELVGRVLELTRLESAPESLGRAPLELRALVAEIVRDADYEARATARRVRLAPGEETTVTGSAAALRSAIENVVRNAVRHAPPETEVLVTLHRDASRATIEVRDRGPGVPESELPELFRPFRRGPGGGAAGLGLAIADRAFRAHEGSIEAATAEGGGLRVAMHLPLPARGEDASLHSPP